MQQAPSYKAPTHRKFGHFLQMLLGSDYPFVKLCERWTYLAKTLSTGFIPQALQHNFFLILILGYTLCWHLFRKIWSQY